MEIFEPEESWYFIYVPSNDAKILDCNFIDNNGHLKGVIFVEDNINCAVTNCTFINNKEINIAGAVQFSITMVMLL